MIKRLLEVLTVILVLPLFMVAIVIATVTVPIFYILLDYPNYLFDKLEDAAFAIQNLFK